MKQTPKRVLIIDDELDHCEIIEECLCHDGRGHFEVTFAHTVRDACRILAEQTFSFVLLDHSLPDGHGCDILEEMDEHLLTTPVIGLSTSADPQVALADFRGGAIEFITKHDAFQGDTLRQRVLYVLANHARRLAAHDLDRRQQFDAITQSSEELVAAARAWPPARWRSRFARPTCVARSDRSWSLCHEWEWGSTGGDTMPRTDH